MKRPKLRGELLERVCEKVLETVKANPGHEVPNRKIAPLFGLNNAQVHTATKTLVERGLLRQENKSYWPVEMPEPEAPEAPAEQATLLDPPAAPAPANNSESGGGVNSADKLLADNIEAKAQEYFWLKDTSIGMSYFKDFIGWLRGENNEPSK